TSTRAGPCGWDFPGWWRRRSSRKRREGRACESEDHAVECGAGGRADLRRLPMAQYLPGGQRPGTEDVPRRDAELAESALGAFAKRTPCAGDRIQHGRAKAAAASVAQSGYSAAR